MSDRVIRWGLVALIAFTPLAFGTVEAWSIALMEWGIWTLVLVEAFKGGRRYVSTGMEAPILLFAAFCLLQTVPLPIGWIQAISPGAGRMYALTDLAQESPVAMKASDRPDDPILHLEAPARRPISVSPTDTRNRLLLLLSFSALFLLVARWADRSSRAVFLMTAVIVTAFAVAFFGLVQYLTWNGRIYWFRRVPSTSSFGPFVNHNHFAGYVGMVIPIAICFAFVLFSQRGREENNEEAISERWGRSGLALFMAVVLVVTLFFSLSRGGILSSALGGIVLFLLASRRMVPRAVTWAAAGCLAAVALALIAWIGADVVSHQIGTYSTIENEASFRLRAYVWRQMIRHADEFPWVGSGLGTFEESFARFTPVGSAKRWDRAHNDYLQLGWETGAAGFFLFLLAAAVFARRYWLPAMRASDPVLGLFRLGLAVSLMTIALHSFVDFNLQIGSNGFLFALLAGLLVALHRQTEGGTVQEDPRRSEALPPVGETA